MCVCPPEITSPAAGNGPIDMIFGVGMEIDDRLPICDESRAKVKVRKVKKKQGFAATFSDRCQVTCL